MELISRHIEPRVREALSDTRIVLVEGARQVGKTTLVKKIIADNDGLLVSLDDPDTRAFARTNPVEFASQAPTRMLAIDELQRAPELVLAMKLVVDRDNRPGQFLVTGSADVFRLPAAGDSLAGRVEGIELHGFSQGELDGHREGFVDRLLAGDTFPGHRSELTRQDYAERAIAGGFPEALARENPKRRNEWLGRYLTQIVRRDVGEVSRIQRGNELPLVLGMIAARNAGELNIAEMANEADIPGNTLRRMIALLESLFLVQTVPAWSTNLTKRAVKRPKISILDSGLAASLMRITPDAVSAHQPQQSSLAGSLLEGFVAGELRKQIEWAGEPAFLSHFRDRGFGEVDLILSTPDGRVAGIEIKATSSPRPSDFTTLRRLREKLGERFSAGVVLHTGESTLSVEERLAAVPMDILWRS